MEISMGKVFGIIRQRIWWIVLSAAVLGILSFAYTQIFVEPTYTSTIKMVVVKSEDRQSTVSDAAIAQRLVNSYVAVLDDINFYDKVAEKSDLDYSGKQIGRMFSFSVIGETEVFEVKITAYSSQESKIIADAAASVALSNPQYKDALDLVTLKQVSAARDGVQVGPNSLRNAILGVLIGALLVFAIALFQEIVDNRIKSEEDFLEHYNLPLLGTIPDFSTDKAKKPFRNQR